MSKLTKEDLKMIRQTIEFVEARKLGTSTTRSSKPTGIPKPETKPKLKPKTEQRGRFTIRDLEGGKSAKPKGAAALGNKPRPS